MLQLQIPQLHETINKFSKMACALSVILFESWFNSRSLTTAAENDLLLNKSLEKFKKVDRAVSSTDHDPHSLQPLYVVPHRRKHLPIDPYSTQTYLMKIEQISLRRFSFSRCLPKQ